MEQGRYFEPTALSVRAARDHVAAVLDAGGFGGDVDAVLLLTSELVTNAVRHARSPFEVVVELEGPSVRVVVLDHDADHRPELRSPGPHDTTGRGLLIVDRLATGWGTFEVAPGHKAVWFSVG